MENISGGPTFGDFVTIRTERSMQGRHGCKTSEYKSLDSHLPPSVKWNVLHESLSVDSHNFFFQRPVCSPETVVSFIFD
jgi:hypothetical protein